MTGKYKYLDTFCYDNIIYGIFENLDYENMYVIVKIFPGYKGHVVESSDEFDSLMKIYEEL